MSLTQLEKDKERIIKYIKETRLQHDNMIKLKREQKISISIDIKHMLEEKKQIIKELMMQKEEIMDQIREHKKANKGKTKNGIPKELKILNIIKKTNLFDSMVGYPTSVTNDIRQNIRMIRESETPEEKAYYEKFLRRDFNQLERELKRVKREERKREME